MTLLQGRTALITGSGKGIGSAVARLFAENGAKVIVHYHSSAESAVALAEQISGVAIKADLRNQNDVDHLFAESLAAYGSVDILVNNASSFSHASSFSDETWETYVEEFNGVFGTTFRPTAAAVPIMKKQGGGRIINFAATLLQRPAVGYGAHSCAKAAVLALTRNLARELGPFNITVNAVSPGMTLTDFSKSLPQGDRDKISALTPLRRLAEASDLATFITGANTAPDGGLAVL
jgi:3-oxoacyl-[acyl-carrier protein] reductase